MASSLVSPCVSPIQTISQNRKLLLNTRRRRNVSMSCCTKPTTSPSPCLIMPGGDGLFNLYCPANDKILPLPSNKSMSNDAKLVGSSRGWLALFDDYSNLVFLSNPISGQRVNLPAIDTLPDPEVNLLAGRGHVSKLILSSSPLEDGCIALMSFGPKDRLAFCAAAATTTKWTPIGDLNMGDYEYSMSQYEDEPAMSDRDDKERSYEDFIYSTRHGLFFCITDRYSEVEAWDLTDPLSPKIHWKIPHSHLSHNFCVNEVWRRWPCRSEQHLADVNKCFHPKYLVSSDHSDDLFVVVRHVAPRMRPDGSVANRIYFVGANASPWDHRYPYKTIDFHVFKIDRDKGELRYMEGSLEGLAIFVGMNHSFAVLASEFPGLKADCVYFTDEDRRITPKWLARTNFGGHDNGVFDNRDKTISSICSHYPVEYEKIRRIVPPPMWFVL